MYFRARRGRWVGRAKEDNIRCHWCKNRHLALYKVSVWVCHDDNLV